MRGSLVVLYSASKMSTSVFACRGRQIFDKELRKSIYVESDYSEKTLSTG